MKPNWKKLAGLSNLLSRAGDDDVTIAPELMGGFAGNDVAAPLEDTTSYDYAQANTITDEDGRVWTRLKK